MSKLSRQELLVTLWYAVQTTMDSFEPGPIHNEADSGFFHLPSGKPMTKRSAAAKFERLRSLIGRLDRLTAQHKRPEPDKEHGT